MSTKKIRVFRILTYFELGASVSATEFLRLSASVGVCPLRVRHFYTGMTIVDKELIGEGSEVELQIPNVPLGIFIENAIQENVQQHGDARWLVSRFIFFHTLLHI